MLRISLLLSVALSAVNAYNVLFLAPTHNVGQFYYMEEFIRELLSRGHVVTSVTCFGARSKHPLHTEIIIKKLDIDEHYPSKNVYGGMYTPERDTLWMRWKLGLINTNYILSNIQMKNLIEDNTKKFDLVVSDNFYQEAMYLFAHKYNCPLVTISHLGQTHAIDQSMGFLAPLSFVPHASLPYADDMTFQQRIYNTFITAYDAVFRRSNYIRAQNQLAKKYFGKILKEEVPHVLDMERKISAVFVNSHKMMDTPRPKMPGVIDVGGAHIKHPAILTPGPVAEFMNSAEDGLIAFSFGTYLKIAEIPQEKLTQIFEVLGSLKQKVLLRAHENIPNLPPNVKTFQWFLQKQVLGHPKTVLFITHGGLLSVQEATSHSVPMLLIPFFNEQQKVAEKVRKNGHGKVINFDDLTKANFQAAIIEILRNQEFKQKAMAASEKFRDVLVNPMEEAMFWMNYVVRHNGAPHLKSSSVNFSLSKYLNYDVGLCFVLLFIASLSFWVFIIKKALKKYQDREQKGKFKYY